MEKRHFITMVMTVVGGLLFSLGMCMCLVTEWNMFQTGVIVGVVGAVELLLTWIVYRKMAGKKPIKLNAKIVGKVIYGIFAMLVFGVGMCMTMVFEGMMLYGIIVGIIGIVLLMFLIPMCIGLKKSTEE